jgi:P-type Mg2+ transporter
MSYPVNLTAQEAQSLLLKHGYNQIQKTKNTAFLILLSQFKSPIVYLLIIAAVITFVVGDYISSVVVSVLIIVNSAIGFRQEYVANNLFQSLQNLTTQTTLVIRDNQESRIDSKFLVPGDIIKLKKGDLIPADSMIIEQNNLTIDESVLTGETLPISKSNEDKIFSGSSISSGNCIAKIELTGQNTSFGEISTLAQKTPKKSEFTASMNRLTKGFIIVGVVFLVVIFGLHFALGKVQSWSETLLFVLALTIGLVPEAMPIVSSLALAHQSIKLAKKGLIIRHQTALEDVGNMDILCSDKTGTLTENKITVVEIDPIGDELGIVATNLASGGSDNIDTAITNYFQTNTDNQKTLLTLPIQEIPFDPEIRMSAKVFEENSVEVTYWKGSSQEILAKCGIQNKSEIYQNILKQEEQGIKPVSFAKEINSVTAYIGTLYFEDKVKANSKELIQKLHSNNVLLKIITGDSLGVAVNVGTQIKLIEDRSEAITASDLDFTNPSKLNFQVNNYKIFARATPIQKFKIIEALQQNSVVGYLGDGINDVPALKLAQIGIVVETASDVAKSTADIIMTKPDLNILLTSVLAGRSVYENVNNYVKENLSSNFGNFFTMGLLSLVLSFQPMLAIQVLINSLIMDLPLMTFAGDNVAPDQIRKPKHQNIIRLVLVCIIIGLVSSVFDFIFVALNRSLPDGQIQTSWFAFSGFTTICLIFSLRTKKVFWKAPKLNLNMILWSIFGVVSTIWISVIGFGYINIVVIDSTQVFKLLGLTLCYFVVSELTKKIYYNHFKNISE